MRYEYSVPDSWFNGLYKDKAPVCSAGRSFHLVHDEKPDDVWLLIHGFRGYPGELVRPAEDLFTEGYDVFVPRLPGCGTCGDDFAASGKKDWLGLVRNAIGDLKTRYRKVHLFGHSMGANLIAIAGCPDPEIGKLVYAAPGFVISFLDRKALTELYLAAPVKKKIPYEWHPIPEYRMHYENAPCDDLYLGGEYWSWLFPKQLLQLSQIARQSLKIVKEYPHDSLLICPMLDEQISVPSAEAYRKAAGTRAKVIEIPNGTHPVLYDMDPVAEELAVQATLCFAIALPLSNCV